MASKKTIAVIGASGDMGSAIARNLSKGNYRLLLFGNHQEKVLRLIEEIRADNQSAEVDAMSCPFDASWEADIIIPAVDYIAEREVAEQIREVATQKIVISISNPLNESQEGLTTTPGTSSAEELQQLLPYSRVVKAFNTVCSRDFARAVIAGPKTDSFIAGDDDEAVNAVAELVSDAGFNPVIAGKLSASRTLENMAVLLIRINRKNKQGRMAGFKIVNN